MDKFEEMMQEMRTLATEQAGVVSKERLAQFAGSMAGILVNEITSIASEQLQDRPLKGQSIGVFISALGGCQAFLIMNKEMKFLTKKQAAAIDSMVADCVLWTRVFVLAPFEPPAEADEPPTS